MSRKRIDLERGAVPIVGLIIGIVIMALIAVVYYKTAGIGSSNGPEGSLKNEVTREVHRATGSNRTDTVGQARDTAKYASFPNDFPKQIPIYEPSSVVSVRMEMHDSNMVYIAILSTDSSIAEVMNFYESEFKKAAWTISSITDSSLKASDGKINLEISISSDASTRLQIVTTL